MSCNIIHAALLRAIEFSFDDKTNKFQGHASNTLTCSARAHRGGTLTTEDFCNIHVLATQHLSTT